MALALMTLAIWQSDPGSVAAAAAGVHAGPLAAAVALVLLDRTLMAYRWIVLVRVFDDAARLPLGALLRLFFVSTFVGTFLPTSVGTDAVRAYGLTRLRSGAASSVASVLMDRLLGVVALLLVTLLGVILAADLLRDTAVVLAIALACAGCAFGIGTIYSERVAGFAASALERLPVAAARRAAAALIAAVRSYASRHTALANVLAGSIAVQLVRILQAYALGQSIGLPVPFVAYVAFIPVILLVMLLPISVYGLGPSQVAFAALFTRVGAADEQAVALSLLFVGLGVVGNLPGALLYATGGARARAVR